MHDLSASFRLLATNISFAAYRGGAALTAPLDFQLTAGDLLILRGANGSGKSSLLRALAGFMPFISGGIMALDGDVAYDLASFRQQECHYLGHELGLIQKASVLENLRYWQKLYQTDIVIDDVIAQFDLAPLQSLSVSQLSAGQQKRLALSRFIIAPRQVWLMDEPFAALDQDKQYFVKEMLKTHLDHGGIAIIATHDALGLEGQILQFDPDVKGGQDA